MLFAEKMVMPIKRVQETNLQLDINGTHQVLAYADDENFKSDDIITVEKRPELLLKAYKDIVFRMNTETSKHDEKRVYCGR